MQNKRPNIIWILVDSVRIYHTDADERGRLPIMDEFAKEALDFRTAITSAPSTIMSVSAMMTGVPSSYQSRDYNSFKYEYDKMKSLPQILRNNDYKTYGILFWPDGRNFLGNIFGDICLDLWEGDFDKNKYWSNDEPLEIFDRFLESDKIDDRFFVWLHLNCRYDWDISDKVEVLLQKLKDKGLYDDSIIVLNSDHGYPDPSRGISFYDKRKYGHDLIMSDDNILAPQLIKFPDIKPQRIEKPISTLDLTPTILHYLGLEKEYDLSKFPTHGLNLFDLIESKNSDSRIVRVDNRFIFQSNKITALRDHRYKYVIYEDEKLEEFYDTKKDTLEAKNLIGEDDYSDLIDKFKKEYQKQYDDIIQYHTNFLDRQYSILFKEEEDLILIGNFNDNFLRIFSKILEKRNKKINVIDSSNKDVHYKIKIISTNTQLTNNSVVVFPVSNFPRLNSEIVKVGKSFKTKGKFYCTNYNLIEIPPPPHWFIYSLKKSKKWFRLFSYSPKTVLIDFIVQINRILKNERD
jgi:hypothetical protein